jgi:hypothetical protein
MVDYQSLRSLNHKVPDPEPDEGEEAAQDATVDVVVNVYRECNNAQSIALRISFRLPDKA